MSREPFWRTTPLAAMSAEEWESLCDGCGRCCLVKLEDEDTGQVVYTDVACRLFDAESCRCRDYENRSALVSDCVRLTADVVASLSWLPPTCAYRLVSEGKDLPPWHPLVSNDPDSVVAAGIAVTGKVSGTEDAFGLFELVDHIVSWPLRWPKGARMGARKTPGKAAGKAPKRAAGQRSANTAEAARPEGDEASDGATTAKGDRRRKAG